LVPGLGVCQFGGRQGTARDGFEQQSGIGVGIRWLGAFTVGRWDGFVERGVPRIVGAGRVGDWSGGCPVSEEFVDVVGWDARRVGF